ncbi:hypothetical protein ACFO0N_12460 [Halobium salinum]|uniref:DUF7311 domain-containing protein n=1 Tax=Halobium salinum TaxID=1364940 RepID=A0ABD5PCT6_9EURY|nr:hypothetical protein [Halobium salinum]
MIRVVLAVALAVALLAASVPAVEDARESASVSALDREVRAVHGAAAGLVDAEDATADGVPGARRTLTVVLPRRGWRRAGVDYLKIGCDPPDAAGDDVISYRLTGGVARRFGVPGVDLDTPDQPVVFTEPGAHRLTLGLARGSSGEEPRVVVRRGTTPSGSGRSPALLSPPPLFPTLLSPVVPARVQVR